MSILGSDPAEQTTTQEGKATEAAVEAKAGTTPDAETPAKDAKSAVSESAPKETAPVAPEKYDLKLPEGTLLDAGRIEELSLFAKEKGLSNEQAQLVLEREHSAVSAFVETQKSVLEAKASEWAESVKSDKEMGGENYVQTAESAKRVIERYADQELKNILNETGYGNHPALVRMISRIGKAMADDKFVSAGAQKAPSGKRDPADVLYGNSAQ